MEKAVEYFVISAIIFGGVYGLMKGFVRVFFSWFSVALGAIFAIHFSYGLTRTFFSDYINNFFIVFLMGVAIFSVVYALIVQLGNSFSVTLKSFQLGALDYLLGGIFGAAQMMLVMGLMIYWISTWEWLNMQSYPVSMFSAYWAEKILLVFGTHVPAIKKLL